MTQVKVIVEEGVELPKYETKGSAGMDVKAKLSEVVVLFPGQRALIPTGVKMEIPVGFELQVRPRSGLAFKNGITVINSPGTIDSDYRGEVKVILINHGNTSFEIKNGDRIGQIVLAKHERIDWISDAVLSETERGEGGFGSTNKE